MMFTNHNANFWNQRYRQPGYGYGTEASPFLKEQQHRLTPGMKALVVGDGEGRNGVWLAAQGLDVLSVDLSAVGLKKAQALANQQQVALTTQCVDLRLWDWPIASYDWVVSIYVHLEPDVRSRLHQAMLKAVKPGGLLVLEAFNQEQSQYQQKYNSGGPKKKGMLMSTEMLQKDFAEGKIEICKNKITTLNTGQFHQGKASVIQLIVQAPPTES